MNQFLPPEETSTEGKKKLRGVVCDVKNCVYNDQPLHRREDCRRSDLRHILHRHRLCHLPSEKHLKKRYQRDCALLFGRRRSSYFSVSKGVPARIFVKKLFLWMGQGP